MNNCRPVSHVVAMQMNSNRIYGKKMEMLSSLDDIILLSKSGLKTFLYCFQLKFFLIKCGKQQKAMITNFSVDDFEAEVRRNGQFQIDILCLAHTNKKKMK